MFGLFLRAVTETWRLIRPREAANPSRRRQAASRLGERDGRSQLAADEEPVAEGGSVLPGPATDSFSGALKDPLGARGSVMPCFRVYLRPAARTEVDHAIGRTSVNLGRSLLRLTHATEYHSLLRRICLDVCFC